MKIKNELNKYKDSENVNKLILGFAKIEIENVITIFNEDDGKVTCKFKLENSNKLLLPTLSINDDILNDETEPTNETLDFAVGVIKEQIEAKLELMDFDNLIDGIMEV